MKCPKCKAECTLQPSENTWCEFYLCEKCQLVYTVTGKCKLCGGDHVRAHRLREGEKMEEGYFIPDSNSSKQMTPPGYYRSLTPQQPSDTVLVTFLSHPSTIVAEFLCFFHCSLLFFTHQFFWYNMTDDLHKQSNE